MEKGRCARWRTQHIHTKWAVVHEGWGILHFPGCTALARAALTRATMRFLLRNPNNSCTMSSELQPIDTKVARSHGFAPPADFRFALHQPAIPVHLNELGALVPTVPLALGKLPNGQFLLVAVVGFADGRNLLVDGNGRWGGLHVPHELRTYPFGVQPMAVQADGVQNFGLCFNHASGLYRQVPDLAQGEQRFFNDEGQPQPQFQQITQQLQRNVAQLRLTQNAVKALLDADLLTPWQMQPRAGHPGETLPSGLFCVDESRLNALQGNALERLHQSHALALAYAQLYSMGRVVVLQRLKDGHAARQQAAAQAPASPDLEVVRKMFEPGQSDTIQFSW